MPGYGDGVGVIEGGDGDPVTAAGMGVPERGKGVAEIGVALVMVATTTPEVLVWVLAGSSPQVAIVRNRSEARLRAPT